MSRKKRRGSGGHPGKPKVRPRVQRPWQPLYEVAINPEYVATSLAAGARPPAAVFVNDLYQVSVYKVGDGPDEDSMWHLSIKRDDREVIHDWRHLQAIKNEIFTPEHMAFEIYPAESKLVDTSNQYHLWVMPHGYELPFGFDEYLVLSDSQIADFNAGRERGEHKGRQREFQPGLPVALGRNEQPGADETMDIFRDARTPMRMKVPGGPSA